MTARMSPSCISINWSISAESGAKADLLLNSCPIMFFKAFFTNVGAIGLNLVAQYNESKRG